MTDDELRRAAAKMRERAKAATPGPWNASSWQDQNGLTMEYSVDTFSEEVEDALEVARIGPAEAGNAEHIASWHPAVALAVADWLDGVAFALEIGDPKDVLGLGEPTAAHAVARAYLGTPHD